MGTSPAVVKRINAADKVALAEPATRDKILTIGFVTMGGSADDFSATIGSELQRWVPLARSLEVKAE